MRPLFPLAACWLIACASHARSDGPPPDPHRVAVQVVEDLQAAAVPDAADGVARWQAAHARFEAVLEPALRARYEDSEVTAIEYRFALVRARLGTGAAPETARRLGERIAAMCADLPDGEA